MKKSLVAQCVVLWLGCAKSAGVDPGSGNSSVATGGGGQGGISATAGAGGTGDSACGNETIDGDEECDGDSVPVTCESLGFTGGMPWCSPVCTLDTSACANEDCHNGLDDDGDGDSDCDDSDCEASCSDACMGPKTVTLPALETATTENGSDLVALSCAPDSGREVVYAFTAPATTTVFVSVFAHDGWNANLAVHTACGDATSEVACAGYIEHPAYLEALHLQVTQGVTYYVTVDGASDGQWGNFQLDIAEAPAPEGLCFDAWDSDHDGMVDCDDPSQCQSTTACNGGAGVVGSSCFASSGCASNGSDPICLGDFPLGYCSEFCDLAADDCPGDAICYDNGISKNGICVDGCTTNTDCAPGTSCVNLGLSTNVCWKQAEQNCNNYQDDDGDGFWDCGDTDCQGTNACLPGSGTTSSLCSAHNQCASSTGNDPVCLLSAWPNGYCSEFCNPTSPDCGPDDVCVPFGVYGHCYLGCNTSADCAMGLSCADFGYGKVCS